MNDPAPVKIWNDYDRPHRDLREFLSRIEGAGELLRVPGAHWNLEMGTLAEAVNERPNPPAVLFQDVPGYPRGFRVLSGSTNSMRRLAITLGFPVPAHPLDVVRAYRDRMKATAPFRRASCATARCSKISCATRRWTCSSFRCRSCTSWTAAATSAPMTS